VNFADLEPGAFLGLDKQDFGAVGKCKSSLCYLGIISKRNISYILGLGIRILNAYGYTTFAVVI
jgi:hypothetical protein